MKSDLSVMLIVAGVAGPFLGASPARAFRSYSEAALRPMCRLLPPGRFFKSWHGVHQPLSNSDSSFFFTRMSTRRSFSSNIHVADVSAISASGISNVSVKGLVRYWPKSTRIVFTSMRESLGEGTGFTSIADALSGDTRRGAARHQ